MNPISSYSICIMGFLLFPFVMGIILLAQRRGLLPSVAGLFTLKPVLATPLWLLIYGRLIRSGQVPFSSDVLVPRLLLTLLPGVGLTLLILALNWRLFFGSQSDEVKRKLRWLLGLDAARWLNSFLLVQPSISNSGWFFILGIVGVFLPTVYAFVAWGMVRKKKAKLAKTPAPLSISMQEEAPPSQPLPIAEGELQPQPLYTSSAREEPAPAASLSITGEESEAQPPTTAHVAETAGLIADLDVEQVLAVPEPPKVVQAAEVKKEPRKSALREEIRALVAWNPWAAGGIILLVILTCLFSLIYLVMLIGAAAG